VSGLGHFAHRGLRGELLADDRGPAPLPAEADGRALLAEAPVLRERELLDAEGDARELGVLRGQLHDLVALHRGAHEAGALARLREAGELDDAHELPAAQAGRAERVREAELHDARLLRLQLDVLGRALQVGRRRVVADELDGLGQAGGLRLDAGGLTREEEVHLVALPLQGAALPAVRGRRHRLQAQAALVERAVEVGAGPATLGDHGDLGEAVGAEERVHRGEHRVRLGALGAGVREEDEVGARVLDAGAEHRHQDDEQRGGVGAEAVVHGQGGADALGQLDHLELAADPHASGALGGRHGEPLTERQLDVRHRGHRDERAARVVLR
jgi:hypothetical protein